MDRLYPRHEQRNNAVFLYDVGNKVPSGDQRLLRRFLPVFSTDGSTVLPDQSKLLPGLFDMGDGTWVYPNTTQIASLSLAKDAPSLLGAQE